MRDTALLLEASYRRVDRAMLPLLWALFIIALCLAPQYGRWTSALAVGVPAVLLPTLLIVWLPSRLFTRLTVATALMVFAALQIHLLSGMTEMHFGVFVLLSLLLAYRDWRPIACAAVVIAIHHVSFNFLQQWGYSVSCFTQPGLRIVALHAAYLVVQAGALGWLAWRMEKDAVAAEELARLSAHLGREAGVFDLRFGRLDLNSELAGAFKNTMDAVHRTLNHVRVNALAMSGATRELTQGNAELEQRTRTQADSLQRTVASMQMLADNVHNNASNANTAAQLAVAARQVAGTGSQAVTEVAGVMGEIRQEAQKISEITGLIDSIAFQTNILALNAAVEAARAGESGRGFAVVASEVRALAQRSATAAKDIRGLITASLDKTDNGARKADDAAAVMGEMVQSVERVATIVAEIGQASQTQRAGIDEVNAAVAEIDQLTGQNAALVGTAAAASASLQGQAAQLLEAIGAFKLYDSAEAMRVHEAMSDEEAESTYTDSYGLQAANAPLLTA
ncbi:chemotaxis protein [Bordetella genomosp. 8]|uniref:Chemotaxis protein n=1 Tax=Bordetella genomosp. 8 TaxID=1416806 RepID=A0A1W6YGR0_9BORD|nr:methyl-accepting chemotaxis protein [Bordetella genomosp. 8]ARP80198.1 chemotaxis protein [Bordetella genomosp. 8]